jgi:hypothetical protein
MQRDEENEIEKYLKKFGPRPIRPLPVQSPPNYRWLIAVAALLAITVAMTYWRSRTQAKSYPTATTRSAPLDTTPEHLSITLLTKLAVDDESVLDKYLTEESRRTLPDMKGSQSTLRVLAKE